MSNIMSAFVRQKKVNNTLKYQCPSANAVERQKCNIKLSVLCENSPHQSFYNHFILAQEFSIL